MASLKSKIIDSIKSRKINVFLLFFLLAFIILLFTKLSKDYTNTIVFNIEPKNLSEEIVVLNDSSHKLNVTVTTYGFKLLKYYLKQPKLFIDFKNDVNKKDSIFIWTSSKGFSYINDQFDKDIKLKSINPDTLKFRFDVNAIKYIPIKSNVNLTYSPGYDVLNKTTITPDSVKVIGPASILSRLNKIETEKFELKEVKTSVNKILKLKLDSINSNLKVANKDIVFNAEVEKFTEGNISVPVQIVNVPKGITLTHFPKSINVSYYTSLKSFKEIEKSDFKVVCDYNELKDGRAYLTPKLVKKPDVVKSTRLHQQKIEFIITE